MKLVAITASVRNYKIDLLVILINNLVDIRQNTKLAGTYNFEKYKVSLQDLVLLPAIYTYKDRIILL